MLSFFHKYYCIKQHDIKDCGPACLATVCKQYGLKVPISKIREVAGTDKQGTNLYGLIKAAEQLGFTAKGFAVIKKAFSTFSIASDCACYCESKSTSLRCHS